jgi:dimethylhistidine N-methyltransferase
MTRIDARPLRLHDFEPQTDDFCAEVIAGLRKAQKELPCKFFYDREGSLLFDRICELDEYYPTRTELAIMRANIDEMCAVIGERCMLVEYGSGSSLKTRILLKHLCDVAAYVPIDISRSHLLRAARALSKRFAIEILPVCADYTADFELPASESNADSTVVYFPGSTIGNFEPAAARDFLRTARIRAGNGSGMLIGVDLKKDPQRLHAAYNDARGVTAQFNLNLLARINREADGDFDLSQFAHYAYYNPVAGRIEMHLQSLRDQVAHVAGETFHFREGETIFTESSYKYTLDEFATLARESGYRVEHVWTDPQKLFSVQYLISS